MFHTFYFSCLSRDIVSPAHKLTAAGVVYAHAHYRIATFRIVNLMAENSELRQEVIEGVTVYRVSRAHTATTKTTGEY